MQRYQSARLILAENIKKARLARGFSQEALAAECGLHRTYVGSVERGERNISIDNVERIAKALRLTVSKLLEGS